MSNRYDDVVKTGVFKLSKPYKFGDGEEVSELKLPLASANGNHIRFAQRNYQTLEGNQPAKIAEFDKVFQAYVAAAIMNVQPDFVFGLPVGDFTDLTLTVQAFLLGRD